MKHHTRRIHPHFSEDSLQFLIAFLHRMIVTCAKVGRDHGYVLKFRRQERMHDGKLVVSFIRGIRIRDDPHLLFFRHRILVLIVIHPLCPPILLFIFVPIGFCRSLAPVRTASIGAAVCHSHWMLTHAQVQAEALSESPFAAWHRAFYGQTDPGFSPIWPLLEAADATSCKRPPHALPGTDE